MCFVAYYNVIERFICLDISRGTVFVLFFLIHLSYPIKRFRLHGLAAPGFSASNIVLESSMLHPSLSVAGCRTASVCTAILPTQLLGGEVEALCREMRLWSRGKRRFVVILLDN